MSAGDVGRKRPLAMKGRKRPAKSAMRLAGVARMAGSVLNQRSLAIAMVIPKMPASALTCTALPNAK